MGSPPEITAQSEYKRILSTYVAPVMKAHGYKRVRNTWKRETEQSRLEVRVWASRFSSRTATSFCATMCVHSRAVDRLIGRELGEWQAAARAGNLPEMAHYEVELGQLTPLGRLYSWEIDTAEPHPSGLDDCRYLGDPDYLGGTFASVIRDSAFPFFETVDTPSGLLEWIERLILVACPLPGVYSSLVLLVRGPAAFRRHWHESGSCIAYERSEHSFHRDIAARLLETAAQMES